VTTGLDRVGDLHSAVAGQRVPKNALMERILYEIRRRLDPRTGVAAIGSLTGMARTLGCATETLRRYLRQLAAWHLIIKNDGNATSMLGTSGITVALDFPEGLREAIRTQLRAPPTDPPISEQTGKPTPQFRDESGWNPSRSPTSHETLGGSGSEPTSRPVAWTLGDWLACGVVHSEFGVHLVRLADAQGKKSVSRVLIRLEELRALRPGVADIRGDAERAADLAARSLARKAAKSKGLREAELRRLLDQASPAGVADTDSTAFVREMARHLDAIIREAKGDPDPWRSARWRGERQREAEMSKPRGNAYAAARNKRDPAAFEDAGADDCSK